MATAHKEFFAALAAPFPPGMVKTRPADRSSGRQLSYITARMAQNRLDDVAGPENWKSEFFETQQGMKCRISIRLPDGEWLGKEDGGGAAGMSEEDNNEKSAFSDSFKRACVQWGIGRHLYGDGVPSYVSGVQAPQPTRQPPAPSTPQRPAAPAPTATTGRDDRDFWGLVCEEVSKVNDRIDPSARSPMAISANQAVNKICERAVAAKHIDRFPPTQQEVIARLALLYAQQRQWVRGELKAILDDVLSDHAIAQHEDNEAPQKSQSQPQQQYGAPKTGKQLFAWIKKREEEFGEGLLKHLNGWAKDQDFPFRMTTEWTEEHVAAGYAEAERYLSVMGPNNDEFSDAA